MNNTRRKSLKKLIGQLEDLKDSLQEMLEEEEEYRDNIPENLQNSEKYEIAEQAADSLATAVDDIEDALSCIEEAIG